MQNEVTQKPRNRNLVDYSIFFPFRKKSGLRIGYQMWKIIFFPTTVIYKTKECIVQS
jgi:hypothetical protein